MGWDEEHFEMTGSRHASRPERAQRSVAQSPAELSPERGDVATILALQGTAGNHAVQRMLAVQRSFLAPDDVPAEVLRRGGAISGTAKHKGRLGHTSTYAKIVGLVTKYKELEPKAGQKGALRKDLTDVLDEVDKQTLKWLTNPKHAGSTARFDALKWVQGKTSTERAILQDAKGYASMLVKDIVGDVDRFGSSFEDHEKQVRGHKKFPVGLDPSTDHAITLVLTEGWVDRVATKAKEHLTKLPDPTHRHGLMVMLGKTYRIARDGTANLDQVLAKLQMNVRQAADLLVNISPSDANMYAALLPRLKAHNLEVMAGGLRLEVAKLPDPGAAREMLQLLNRVFQVPVTGVEDLRGVMPKLGMTRGSTEQFLASLSDADAKSHVALLDAFKAYRLIEVGEAMMDKLHWLGGSGPEGKYFEIDRLTAGGYWNDFALWMLGTGPEPNDNSTMNCWQAVLFMGYRAGLVGYDNLKQMHDDASADGRDAAFAQHTHLKPLYDNACQAARTASDATAAATADKTVKGIVECIYAVGGHAYYETLERGMYKGGRTQFNYHPSHTVGSPDLPAGSVIFIDGVGHVMFATGTRDPNGRHEVISHWIFPWPGGQQWLAAGGGKVQRTTLEEMLAKEYKPQYDQHTPPQVEFAKAPW